MRLCKKTGEILFYQFVEYATGFLPAPPLAKRQPDVMEDKGNGARILYFLIL